MFPSELKNIRRVDVPSAGLPADNNHDPSNIIYADGLYYLWYTQHRNDRPYDHYTDCKIMCVTSQDGETWSEGFDALLPGEPGAWDEAGVLTANVTVHEGKYYMFYTGVQWGYNQEAKDEGWHCGLAVANHPRGPWVRMHDRPVLVSGPEGAWDDRDTDDATAIYRQRRWWIYYKGTSAATPSSDNTLIGVAFGDQIDGPYTRYEGGALIRGHAFALWPYKDGVLLLSGLKHDSVGKIYGGDWNDPAGVQYLYYSEDGLHFTPVCEFPNRACGIYWPQDPALRNDIRNCWGISVSTRDTHKKRYLQRFRFEEAKT